jgi:hypothetical protein
LLGAQRLTAILDVERTRALRTFEQSLGLWPRSEFFLHHLADLRKTFLPPSAIQTFCPSWGCFSGRLGEGGDPGGGPGQWVNLGPRSDHRVCCRRTPFPPRPRPEGQPGADPGRVACGLPSAARLETCVTPAGSAPQEARFPGALPACRRQAPGYSIDPPRGSNLGAMGVKMSHYPI